MTANAIAGGLQLAWIKAQSAFDTIEAYAAADAVSPERGTFKIDPTVNFETLKETSGTFSNQGEIKLDRGGKFSGSFLFKPAAAGTPCDIFALIKAAMGVQTTTPATSDVFTLSDTATPVYLQGAINIASQLQHCFSGGYVEEMTIEIPQKGLPTFSFSGPFARFGWAYADVIGTGGVSTGASSCPLGDTSRGSFGVGAVVAFVDDNNSNTGYTVTDVDNTSGSAHFHFSPVLAGAGENAGGAIIPVVPSQTVGGTVIAGTTSALTVGGVTLGFISGKITLKTGLVPRQEAGTDRITGVFRGGERVVEGEFKFYLLDSAAGWTPMVGGAHEPITRAITLRIGTSSAGSHVDFSIPKARLDIAQVDIPAADVVTGTMKFVARQSAAAADEFSITFD